MPQASSTFIYETHLPMSYPLKHAHARTHAYTHTDIIVNLFKIHCDNLLNEELTRSSLPPNCVECCNGVSSLIPHILHFAFAMFTTLYDLGHLATLNALFFFVVNEISVYDLASSPPPLKHRHIMSSHHGFLTKVISLKMSGQANYKCIHEKDSVTMEL